MTTVQPAETATPPSNSTLPLPKERFKLLDTNVIIDGRIADVARAGFLEGPIYIPGFILDELQHIADSPDGLERQRGRRGLDALQSIQSEPGQVFTVRVYDKLAPDQDSTDARLVRLAEAMNGVIVTNDFRLDEAAKLQGVQALNVNELASALKPNVPPTPLTSPPGDIRIGHGYDVHAFALGRRLFLGGVEFKDAPLGLLGHSDADVLLHAICDALLGAAGLGDIGVLFPPSDPVHKDRASLEFLREVAARVQADGWTIANIDATLLAETPKISPHADEMKTVIAQALAITPSQVGVKATTNEKLGFVGRGEGIAAHAVALIRREGGGKT